MKMTKNAWRIFLLGSLMICKPCSLLADDLTSFFEQRIRPVLAEHCYGCHSQRAVELKGNLYLDTKAGWQKGGDSGAAAIIPHNPEDSLLLRCIEHLEPGLEMPPGKAKLPDSVLADFKTWISTGAIDPREGNIGEIKRADKSWWSLQPLRNEFDHICIDEFIDAKLANHGLTKNPEADPRTLIRRMTYDVTGLPPTADEVASFVASFENATDSVKCEKVVEDLVDRLLASPRYGEQWGRHWLDVVRFGESNGFERNFIINDLYPFRDYVIQSLNQDKPFNQFIVEHLAGDVVGKGNPAVEVASAFLVAGPYDDVGNQDAIAAANIRAATIDDMITATSSAFLGLTIHCARCHHHKFDPVPTEDYYRLRACFEGTRHGRRVLATEEQLNSYNAAVSPLNAELNILNQELQMLDGDVTTQLAQLENSLSKTKVPTAGLTEIKTAIETRTAQLKEQISLVKQKIAAIPALPQAWIGTHSQQVERTFVHQGGDPTKPLSEVVSASLSVLDQIMPPYQVTHEVSEGERRLKLAQWITDDRNALTSRVLANRIWQYHFGNGIVDTPSDFGYLGSIPTHPELLDFLAQRLLKYGWRAKALHREILLSKTYRQSSVLRDDAKNVDQDSRLLWRFPPRRLSGEEIRDTILSIAGKLQLEPMGGPGFRLYSVFENNVSTYTPLDQVGPETYRRAVYHQNVRASIVDVLSDFDLPDTAFSSPKRANTTSPMQALTMLNHSFMVDMSSALADRFEPQTENAESKDIEDNSDVDAVAIRTSIEKLYQTAYQRNVTERELELATQFVTKFGLRAFARVILNSNELIYIE